MVCGKLLCNINVYLETWLYKNQRLQDQRDNNQVIKSFVTFLEKKNAIKYNNYISWKENVIKYNKYMCT